MMYRTKLMLIYFIFISSFAFCQYEHSTLSGRELAMTNQSPNTILTGALVVIIDAKSGDVLAWDKTDDWGIWRIDKLPVNDRPVIVVTYFVIGSYNTGYFFFNAKSTFLMGGDLSFGPTWSALWTSKNAKGLIKNHGLISSRNIAEIDIWGALYKLKLLEEPINAKNYEKMIRDLMERVAEKILKFKK